MNYTLIVNMMRTGTYEILKYYSYKSKYNLLCEISFKISSSHYSNIFDMSMILVFVTFIKSH